MMQGLISADREAVLRLRVRGPDGREETVEAIIDTGFNGFLTLPAALISNLALPFIGITQATLGDGTKVRMDVYETTLLWDNQKRVVLALASQSGVLVGMFGPPFDFKAGISYPRGVGQCQIRGGGGWLRRDDLNFSGATFTVVGERIILETHGAHPNFADASAGVLNP